MHKALHFIKNSIYDNYNFEFANLQIEAESSVYGACSFTLNNTKIIHRCSKITPTKTGQFVTIWKRNEKGITTPFSRSDDFDFFIITVKKDENLGQFIFSKSILEEKGIIDSPLKKGKRGMRVYAPWDNVTNVQARKTQEWQGLCFIEMGDFDSEKMKNCLLTNVENGANNKLS